MIKLEAKDLGDRIAVKGSGENSTLGELRALITSAIVKLDDVSDNNNMMETLMEVIDMVMAVDKK